jgi:F0F1-type ATP synthase membrane subunit b/b'
MSNTKRFLYILCAVYVGGAVLGLALFRTPGYSGQYMQRYEKDHAKYREITESEVYKAYVERPKLHPLDEKQRHEIAFAEEYAARPEFKAEKRRMACYTYYFKVLNSAVFILLLVKALRNPVVTFLDGKIKEIRTELDGAEKARAEAEAQKSDAQAKLDQWADTEVCIGLDTDNVIERDLAQIRDEFDQARVQLAKETADRKQAELYRAARLIREDLVLQAISLLEMRYKTEATQERLAQNVDEFVRLMDRIS